MSTAGASEVAVPDHALPWRHLIAFSTTNFGKSLFWTMADIFALVFATDTLGLEPAIAGSIILIALIWDAVSDPLAGSLIDRIPGITNAYGRIIRSAAPVGAVFLILIFAAQFVPPPFKPVSFAIALLAFRTMFTLVDIPDNALFSRIARRKADRLFGASARKLMATAAAVTLSLSTGWVFSEASPFTEGMRIFLLACLVAPAGAAALILGSASVRRCDHSRTVMLGRSWHLVLGALRNPAVLGLAAHMFLATLGMAVFMTALVFYARFILGEEAWYAAAMTVFLIAQASGVVIFSWIASRSTTGWALSGAAALASISTVFFLTLPISVSLIVSCGVFGLSAGGLNALRWAAAPAAIDQAEARHGFRDDAIIMAMFSLAIKSAIGFASLFMGATLSISGYAPDIIANEQQALIFRLMVGNAVIIAVIAAIIPIRLNLCASE